MNYLIAVLSLSAIFLYDSSFFTVYTPELYNIFKALTYLMLLAIYIKYAKLRNDFKIGVIALYFYLVMYLFVPCIISGGESLFFWFKVAIRISFIIIFIGLMRVFGRKLIESCLNLYIFFSVILAIQTIFLFFFVMSGHAPSPTYIDNLSVDNEFKSYGVLGFANWVIEKNGLIAFRTQSIFSEATKFALFQILPFFVCISRSKQFLIYRISSLFITASIITTFSFSAFVGIFTGLLFYFFSNLKKQKNGFMLLLVIFLSVAFMIGAYLYVTDLNNFEKSSLVGMLFAKHEGSTSERMDWASSVFDTISEQPLGADRFDFDEEHGMLPAAPIQWFLLGGYIGGILMLFIQFWLFRKHYLRGIYSDNKLVCAIASGCIALMVTSIVHGNWSDLFYLFPISLLVSLQKNLDSDQYRIFVPESKNAG